MNWLDLIVPGVLVILIATWVMGFLNQVLPSPAWVWLAVAGLWRDKPQRSEDGFRIVLCWLENDRSGEDTRNVARAFTGVEGVTLVRSARIVKASGAVDDWYEAMQKSAHAVLEDWEADLAVVGLVKRSGEALSLWFVPRLGGGTLGRGDRPYKLEDVTLGADFHDDLRTQLAAVALAAVAPLADNEVRGQVLEKGLRDATEKLSNLLNSGAIGRAEHRAALHVALGNALATLGERESGPARLEQAVEAYRAALEEYTRERVTLQWARTQNNLGNALAVLGERESGPARLEQAVAAYRAVLGERESGMARLEQAVAAYHAALKEYTRERVPFDWAMTQNNLGSALRTLGERESGTARLEQAVEAFRAAFDEFAAKGPLWWRDRAQRNLDRVLDRLHDGAAEPGTAAAAD